MIRVFVSDIDGCLAEPYTPYALPTIAEIRDLGESGDPDSVPASPPGLALCTGRAYGYTEAMAQVLGLRLPALFEAGAGMYDPAAARRYWHPAFTEAVASEVGAIKRWVGTIAEKANLSVDTEKVTQAGLFGPLKLEVDAVLPDVIAFIEANHPGFFVSSTPISIDIVYRGLSKREGIEWMAERLDYDMSAFAYIGDTNGDLGALGAVGRSFAPANAYETVRAAVMTTTRGSAAAGVLEAYRICIDENRAL